MIKRGYSFQFEVPDDWVQFKQNTKLVVQGKDDEEIIIAGWTVRGSGSDLEFLTLREQLLQNAIQSINLVTSDPSVMVVTPLHQEKRDPGLDQWSISAKIENDDVLFEASIFRSDVGVLLITFEAPNKPDIRTAYERLIRSVQAAESYKETDEFEV